MRCQVLRIAGPRKGRALKILRLAYDRDNLSPDKSQTQFEQDALLALGGEPPRGGRTGGREEATTPTARFTKPPVTSMLPAWESCTQRKALSTRLRGRSLR